ncbi:MAG: hypothetical protein ABI346_02840 [Candidatus Baltobacteraceae bacterium]
MMALSRLLRTLPLAGASALVVLTSACQGSYSTGSQLPAPGQYGQQQPVYPQSAPSRQQYVEATVALPSAAPNVVAAELAGFSVRLDLVKPSPTPASSPTPAASTGKKKVASTRPSPSPKASALATSTPVPGASPSPSAKPKPTPSGPRIQTKLTIYPDGAQKPPGDPENLEGRRVPLAIALMQPSVDLSLYSLDAIHFSVPESERTDKRGFTIALYETRKHHKDREITSRVDVTAADDGDIAVRGAKDAIQLKKGHAYTAILFADPPAQTPAPVAPAPAYPPSSPTPYGYQQQQYPGQMPYGQPGQPGQPVYPGQPGYPQVTPTPYRPF